MCLEGECRSNGGSCPLLQDDKEHKSALQAVSHIACQYAHNRLRPLQIMACCSHLLALMDPAVGLADKQSCISMSQPYMQCAQSCKLDFVLKLSLRHSWRAQTGMNGAGLSVTLKNQLPCYCALIIRSIRVSFFPLNGRPCCFKISASS